MNRHLKECWKDIPGYENIYQASSLGRIRSVEGKVTYSVRYGKRVWKERILKPKAMPDYRTTGYRIALWKNKKPHDYLVARLVATTHIENLISTDLTVNHIDGDRLNNSVDNLEWLTLADNIRHGFRTGLFKNNQKEITLLDVTTGELFHFNSMAEASRFVGRNNGFISLRLVRENYQVGKYRIQIPRGESWLKLNGLS